jgi:hypothetical protein
MGVFLWVSDMHFDPFYGESSASGSDHYGWCNNHSSVASKPYGQAGCDAPFALIEECLKHMSSSSATDFHAESDADFILVTGDFSRHGTEHLDNAIEETTNILSKLGEAIQGVFPKSVHVLPSVGNNDVFPDYYLNLEEAGDSNPILNISVQGFKRFFVSQEEIDTFTHGGYFRRDVSARITILNLNTVMYSVNHQPDQTSMEDPMGQFYWMEQQLQRAAASGRVVYIVGHSKSN